MVKYLEKTENFFDLVQEGNYIVDFYADWCGPCQIEMGYLEELEKISFEPIEEHDHYRR